MRTLLACLLAGTVTATADWLLGWGMTWTIRSLLLVTVANGAQVALGGWLHRQSGREKAVR